MEQARTLVAWKLATAVWHGNDSIGQSS